MGLKLSNAQSSDAKTLYLTDESTWGTDGVPALGSVISATLTFTKQEPTDTAPVSYSALDILSVFTDAAGDAIKLIFPVQFTTVPTLEGTNVLSDGIWTVQYTINGTVVFAQALGLLLDQNIKTKVYQKLAALNTKYICANNYYTKPISDINTLSGLHYSMEANAYVAKTSEVLNILETLQRQTE